MKKIFFAALAIFVMFGTAEAGWFGSDNPLVGKWQIDAKKVCEQVGGFSMHCRAAMQEQPFEFTRNSIIDGSREVKASYKVEKGRVGVVTREFGEESTDWLTIVDENTIEKRGRIVKTYRRVK